jgi:hypothetical protein
MRHIFRFEIADVNGSTLPREWTLSSIVEWFTRSV